MSADRLVSTEWLQAHLADPKVVVLEASVDRATYAAGHIPGARWVDVHRDMLLGGEDSSGHPIPPEAFAALMSRLGVSPRSTVVWYGDRHSALAIRGFWTMQLYKHPAPFRVILDGGRERWIDEGRPLTQELPSVSRTEYPVPPAVDASDCASLAQVLAAIGDQSRVLLDVRARDEYEGTNVRAARGGRIPGAVHVEWTDATAAPNVRKSVDELRRMYEDQGVTPDKEIITYCQLGIRAAHTWYVLKHVLGYPNVRNYAGSWQEWGNREDTPIE
jgi:thiosulfate/3-mercaptopyruvate sulfurtransferase